MRAMVLESAIDSSLPEIRRYCPGVCKESKEADRCIDGVLSIIESIIPRKDFPRMSEEGQLAMMEQSFQICRTLNSQGRLFDFQNANVPIAVCDAFLIMNRAKRG